MAHKSRRAKRRGQQQPKAAAAEPSSADRYQKYLPEWMKDGSAVPRPPRPRRARQQRPVGGYTPGKFALGDTFQ